MSYALIYAVLLALFIVFVIFGIGIEIGWRARAADPLRQFDSWRRGYNNGFMYGGKFVAALRDAALQTNCLKHGLRKGVMRCPDCELEKVVP